MTFTVGDGEIVVIVGPSGCGKSTLIYILAGFEPPDGGDVLVDNRPRGGATATASSISQHGSVFPWLTVRQNLMFGLNHGSERDKIAARRRIIELVALKASSAAIRGRLPGRTCQAHRDRRAPAKPAQRRSFHGRARSALDAFMACASATNCCAS